MRRIADTPPPTVTVAVTRIVGLAIGLVVALAVALSSSPAPAVDAVAPGAAADRPAPPKPAVTRLVKGLENVWDVQRLPDGRLLLTEREGRLWVWRKGNLRRVAFPRKSVWASGETGLMSLAVDPGFTQNRRFYTCQGAPKAGGGHQIQVRRWRLSADHRRARPDGVLLGGIRAAGIHAGCRLQLDREDGALWVSTGDAAIGTAPRDLTSLNGKTLRLDRRTGKPWPDNPFIDAERPRQRYVVSYGHRNVQGLAQRDDGAMWSVEHGPDRDDEINLIEPGGDYGWNPVPGYDQSVPMTDQALPGDQIDARWSSGVPTLATSGAAWVHGKRWGSLRGTLAVATLKASKLVFYRFTEDGQFVSSHVGVRKHGRLRSVTALPNGNLLVTTDKAAGDGVLLVRPRG